MAVVIIGGGHAGASTAVELRRAGYTDPIIIVGEEPHLPYQRPPLSKAWLKGQASHDSLSLRPAAWYDKHGITLRLSSVVTAIEREARSVALSDGSTVPYDALVLATGTRARRLAIPGSDLDGVLYLRTADDADALKARLLAGCRIAIVGGGYVGLEIAASAWAIGAEVTVLERETRLLARVACPPLSDFFARLHTVRGVDLRLGAAVSGFIGADGAVTGVQMADGTVVSCDVVVVGIGADPNDALAVEAGLDCSDGVVVDAGAMTSAPAIYAVGDVTRRPMARYDRAIRFESVPNALEQAKQVAAALTGQPLPAEELPWFWSDQYDVKLQIAGMAFDCEQIVMRGDVAANKFCLFHLRGDHIVAVEAINSPGEFMVARSLIDKRLAIDPALLADAGHSIKQCVKDMPA